MPRQSTLYDSDFYAWTVEQAALLRAGKFDQADIANIAEEIESLGRDEKRRMRDRLTLLLARLLQWQVQRGWRCKAWQLKISEHRLRLVQEHLADNPSLGSILPKMVTSAWPIVVLRAARKLGFDKNTFPPVCPWPATSIIDDRFWPK
jgi:hypothetical protein